MIVPKALQQDRAWWNINISIVHNQIRTIKLIISAFLDALTIGWAAACEGSSIGALWSAHERSKHINFLELTALFQSLRCFPSQWRIA